MAGPPFVLIDRDGTLVVDVAFLDDPAGLEVLPTVVEGLQRLAAAGCELAVVTNQAGVARWLVTGPPLRAVQYAVRPVLLLDNQIDNLQDREFHARCSAYQRHGGSGP